eukprot:9581301-Alexandrium_andersonii.AAC.3
MCPAGVSSGKPAARRHAQGAHAAASPHCASMLEPPPRSPRMPLLRQRRRRPPRHGAPMACRRQLGVRKRQLGESVYFSLAKEVVTEGAQWVV